MTKLAAGKEVLSHCNKCKLTLAHIVVVMKSDTEIGKVKCLTCKTVHTYRDPSTVKAKNTKMAKARPEHREESIADMWMEAINKSTAKSKQYVPTEKFILGDIIDHPTFGPGVIDKLIDNNKIQVIFRHDIKTLMHNIR